MEGEQSDPVFIEDFDMLVGEGGSGLGEGGSDSVKFPVVRSNFQLSWQERLAVGGVRFYCLSGVF